MNVDLGDILSVIVSLVSLLLSIYTAKKQHYLELKSWADQHLMAIRNWADDVCDAISEAIYIIDNLESYQERRVNCLIRMSKLLDTGRWYFPNHNHKEYGTDKPPAYRGIRQPILDCVAAAHDCLNKIDENSKVSKGKLIDLKRYFVSYIQVVLDPRKQAEEVEKVRRVV